MQALGIIQRNNLETLLLHMILLGGTILSICTKQYVFNQIKKFLFGKVGLKLFFEKFFESFRRQCEREKIKLNN